MLASRHIGQKIREIFKLDKTTITRTLRNKKMNTNKFYDLITSKNALKRRDEFYTYFESENIADMWWEQFTDWYITHNKNW